MIYRASFRSSQNDSFSRCWAHWAQSCGSQNGFATLPDSTKAATRLLWPTFKLFLRPLYIAVYTQWWKIRQKTLILQHCERSENLLFFQFWRENSNISENRLNNIFGARHFVWFFNHCAYVFWIAKRWKVVKKCHALLSSCNATLSSAKMSKLPANYTVLEDNKIAFTQNWMNTLHVIISDTSSLNWNDTYQLLNCHRAKTIKTSKFKIFSNGTLPCLLKITFYVEDSH